MAEHKKHEKYEESRLFRIRHSTAHVMAQAVLEKFPEAKIAIGPPIEDGFYYDFDLPRPLTPEDLDEIENRMRQIIQGKHEFQCKVVSADEARQRFQDQPYKLELIEGLEKGGVDDDGNPESEVSVSGNPDSEVSVSGNPDSGGSVSGNPDSGGSVSGNPDSGGSVRGEPAQEKPVISLYQQDSFTDLCRGPHVDNTAEINPDAIKLMNVAGAYWRGDEHRPMLQRIYGTAWETPEQLKDYLWKLEEAKKRDHRKIGRELDLFSIEEDIGGGLVLWHPKGGLMRKIIEDFWNEQHEKSDYDFVYSPHIGRAHLWEKSGHLGFYKENMYSPLDIEGQQYYLKPMNCPFHIYIYKSHLRSYRDLPLRYAEKGTVYRFERSGVLHGLLRVRGFTQDDAHHFVRPDQMPAEIDFALNFSLNMLRAFGLSDFVAYLSTKPDKSVGEPEDWEAATAALEDSLQRSGLPYEVDEGGGAFYGPKIDLKVRDMLGREWQLSTIQFDFNLPERFDLTYIGEDGQPHRPYMVHRALLGSIERFFAVLIEHYAGAFPVWLSPIQARVISIADRHADYAKQVQEQLKAAGVRADVDDGFERMQAKIRNAQMQKIPYMLVVGDKEMEAGAVALRLRSGENPGPMPLADFIARAKKEIEEKV